jgi:hypothetical protein
MHSCVSHILSPSTDSFDRHTTISGVLIQFLNRLKSLALNIFPYGFWLHPTCMMTHHTSYLNLRPACHAMTNALWTYPSALSLPLPPLLQT